MFARTAALFVIVVAGCAGPQRSSQIDSMKKSNTGLYIGHSTNGDVVVAANHYDAITGLATTSEDLGLTAPKGDDGQMLCQREMLTGTHVPRWICRYAQDVQEARRLTRDWLDQPRLSFSRGIAPTAMGGRGPGGGGRGNVAP
jgi:hypothetical protein